MPTYLATFGNNLATFHSNIWSHCKPNKSILRSRLRRRICQLLAFCSKIKIQRERTFMKEEEKQLKDL